MAGSASASVDTRFGTDGRWRVPCYLGKTGKKNPAGISCIRHCLLSHLKAEFKNKEDWHYTLINNLVTTISSLSPLQPCLAGWNSRQPLPINRKILPSKPVMIPISSSSTSQHRYPGWNPATRLLFLPAITCTHPQILYISPPHRHLRGSFRMKLAWRNHHPDHNSELHSPLHPYINIIFITRPTCFISSEPSMS